MEPRLKLPIFFYKQKLTKVNSTFKKKPTSVFYCGFLTSVFDGEEDKFQFIEHRRTQGLWKKKSNSEGQEKENVEGIWWGHQRG